MLKGEKLGFIGGGNMAEAIIKGLLAGGVPSSDIFVAEPFEERRGVLRERYGVNVVASNDDVVDACPAVVLAVKPQVFREALSSVDGAALEGKLFISIMAGVTTAAIEAAFSVPVRVVRVMPNTPALVLEAASAISMGKAATNDDLALTRWLFDLVGKTCLVEEKLLDAVTGLSGSGPAYVFTFIEALADAGVKNGLPRDVAANLAAQTVLGSARLVLETREHPAILREKVTSPGGTTIAGVAVLEREAFRGAVISAVDAATARSIELGKR